jgi:hypothetical protein
MGKGEMASTSYSSGIPMIARDYYFSPRWLVLRVSLFLGILFRRGRAPLAKRLGDASHVGQDVGSASTFFLGENGDDDDGAGVFETASEQKSGQANPFPSSLLSQLVIVFSRGMVT